MSMCDWCRVSAICNQPGWHKRAVINGDLYCDGAIIKKMPIISFGHTLPCFVSENKSVTRRNWTERHLSQFNKGDICKAYSKGAQYGGECIGILKLTETPYKQNTGEMPDEDYTKEGFCYLDVAYDIITDAKNQLLQDTFNSWKEQDITLSVVPFEILEIFPGMKDKYTTDEEIIKAVKALQKAIG